MIRELLHKKHYDPEAETDWKEHQKIYAFLVRKGFSAEAIRKAIGGMHSDDF
jgi:regulatory protein